MVNGRSVTTLLLIVVALNPFRISSESSRGTRGLANDGDLMAGMVRRQARHQHAISREFSDEVLATFEHAQHHHQHERQIKGRPIIDHAEEVYEDDEDDEHGKETEGKIHIHAETTERRVREDGEKVEGESGKEQQQEATDVHFHIRKKGGGRSIDVDNEVTGEGSGAMKDGLREEELLVHHENGADVENLHARDKEKGQKEWKNFDVHLRSYSEKDEDFGFITDEEEAESPETDDTEHSGEEIYDHDRLQTLQLHRRVRVKSTTQHARDGHDADHVDSFEHELIGGEDDDLTEHSGEDDGNGFDQHEAQISEKMNRGGDMEASVEESEHFDLNEKSEEISGDDGQNHVRDGRVVENLQGKDPGYMSGEDESMSGENPDSASSSSAQEFHRHNDVHQRKKHTSIKPEEKLVRNEVAKQTMFHSHQDKRNKTVASWQEEPDHAASVAEEDLYIDESDEPREKLHEVEVRDDDLEEGSDDTIGMHHRRIEDALQMSGYPEIDTQNHHQGTSRHLLQAEDNLSVQTDTTTSCIHPRHRGPIADGTIVYVRTECRLCQCIKGKLECEPRSETCGMHQARPCILETEEAILDGARHFHGCNLCLCRDGKLLCTRSRCPSNEDVESKNHILSNDSCMQCDREPLSPVCGPNWKTYSTMCHAQECAGFHVEDIKQGKCEHLDPCAEAKCKENEICLPLRSGPCLASITTDGQVVECPQYRCVFPRQDCSFAEEEEVCGADKKTYSNLCSMFAKGVPLAYYGPCSDMCEQDDSTVCGVDGVTLESHCHASFRNSHVDYMGNCEDDNDTLIINSSVPEAFVKPQCKMALEMLRCLEADCEKPVIPEGACCPICGSAVSIRLDRAASDMIDLTHVKPSQPFNSLDFVQANLENLLDQFVGSDKCQLTTDLLETNDITVVYTPLKSADQKACEAAGKNAVKFINSPERNDMDPFQALVAAAVLLEKKNHVELDSTIPKQRERRVVHHEHEPMFENKGQACCGFPLFTALCLNLCFITTQIYN